MESISLSTIWENCSISLRCCLFANLAFWSASVLNVWVDHLAYTKTVPWLSELKLQKDRYLSRSELWDVVTLAGFNLLVVAPLICCPLFEWGWDSLYPSESGIRLMESSEWNWKREILLLPVDMFVNEVSFYVAHYVMHRWLYQSIHKVHHRFKAPCAMAAAYAHPLEFIFGNVLCIALGPIITNGHPYTSYFYFTMAILSTCKGHSGYNFLNAVTHDNHHQYSNYNYGVLHIGDFVMGTTYIPPIPKKQ